MEFEWNSEKNMKLKRERDVCFEDIVSAIYEGKLLDIIEHSDKGKYPNQQVYIVEFNGYAWLVPFVKNGNTIFLKTIYPDRKMTKKYLNLWKRQLSKLALGLTLLDGIGGDKGKYLYISIKNRKAIREFYFRIRFLCRLPLYKHF